MTPFIRDGDIITIERLKGNAPATGSIVAFARLDSDMLVIHRVVSKKGKLIFIKGDNGEECVDEIIPAENILGYVSQIERDGKLTKLGIGMEGLTIAWLSRMRLLIPARKMVANFRRRSLRKGGSS